MASKNITTQLKIKAIDQYSSIIKGMGRVTGRFADTVRRDVGKLQELRGPLKLIKDFRTQRQVVDKSAEALSQAQNRVHQLKKALLATKTPTAQMRREFDRARTAAQRLEGSHRKNRTALHSLQKQLTSAKINTNNLAGAQDHLSRKLDAATGPFNRQIGRMRRLSEMQEKIITGRERMDRSLARAANVSFVGSASTTTGRRILRGASTPIAEAIEFESAMSDVRKVVDFESPEAFGQMSGDILKLSTTIPMTAAELAAIVAAGGQSGIANEELTRFAELAAKIGVAFDISADQSGAAMAKIKTAMNLDLDQTSSLFDAMNHLSNNSAARADQTLNFLNRAGGDGAKFGFDSTSTLAIGAAMIAAGAGADTAATSFRNMGRALTKGESATKRQSAAYARLGLDAVAVSKNMQTDAVGTTMDVLQRLNELPKHLQSSVMSDLFGDEARELTKLINNMDLMPQMLGMVADQRDYLGSAEAEYGERAKTTANNLQLLRNQTSRLGISIGEVVLPPLNELVTKAQVMIDHAVTWTKANPKLTKTLVTGGLALGAMAVAGGVLLTTAAGLIGTMAVLRFGLVGLGARALFAGGGMGGLAARFLGLAKLPKFRLSSLLTPVKWGSKLVSFVPWALLTGGKFALKGLLTPVRWGGKLVSRIPWAALTGGKFALSGLLTPVRWVASLVSRVPWAILAGGKFALKGLLTPVRWGAKLVSRIPWAVLTGGKFALSTLIKPLVWTASLLPVFAPALARFSGFRRNASTEITRLSSHVGRQSAAMNRSLSSIRWGALSAGAMAFTAMQNLPENPDELGEFQEGNQRAMDRTFRTLPGISHLVAGYETTFKWFHGRPPPVPEAMLPKTDGIRDASRTVQNFAGETDLPTTERLEGLRQFASELGAEIAMLTSQLEALGPAPTGYDLGSPEYQKTKAQLDAQMSDLALVEAELISSEDAAQELGSALQVLSGTDVTPEISAESIDRALAKVTQLAAKLRALPSPKAGWGGQSSVGAAREVTALAGARAFGGPIKAGLSYMAGELGPEPIFSSKDAFVATHNQLQVMQRAARGIRSAGLAAATVATVTLPALAMPASAATPAPAAPSAGQTQGNGTVQARIEIGSISITAPSGVSDPEGLVNLLEQRLGDRLGGVLAASFSN